MSVTYLVEKLKANRENSEKRVAEKGEEGLGGDEWRGGESKVLQVKEATAEPTDALQSGGSWRWPRLWKRRWFITETINQQVWPSLHTPTVYPATYAIHYVAQWTADTLKIHRSELSCLGMQINCLKKVWSCSEIHWRLFKFRHWGVNPNPNTFTFIQNALKPVALKSLNLLFKNKTQD